ncbi:hypothetical protein AB0L82_37735 [Nocardia sp. NPDC052001]|uniref:hypothetical protein n=1 Tax=Nocardia sp. NPDC052001 TaxID=3154853 RepID=UPI003419EF0C
MTGRFADTRHSATQPRGRKFLSANSIADQRAFTLRVPLLTRIDAYASRLSDAARANALFPDPELTALTHIDVRDLIDRAWNASLFVDQVGRTADRW